MSLAEMPFSQNVIFTKCHFHKMLLAEMPFLRIVVWPDVAAAESKIDLLPASIVCSRNTKPDS
jgi:hypothetical protein